MTSTELITQLVDEAVGKRKRGDPQGNDNQQKKNCQPEKRFTKTFFKTDISLS